VAVLALQPQVAGKGHLSLLGPQVARGTGASQDTLRIVLLGTGIGPPVTLDQYGPSTLVEVGDARLLFDVGRGASLRLAQVGVPIQSVSRLFLTHLHSDHVLQIPDLLLAGWWRGRRVPLEVWGPDGTRDMMEGLLKAYSFDIHVRRDVDQKNPAEGITVVSRDIREGVVLEQDGLKVTAFLVDHAPVSPAFGYRVDYRGRSVALSGDTRFSENLIRHAAGVDVLIHEAFDPVPIRAASTNPVRTEAIIAHHTTPEQAGQVFARVKPRLAVYSHAPATASVIEQTRKTYTGPLQGAQSCGLRLRGFSHLHDDGGDVVALALSGCKRPRRVVDAFSDFSRSLVQMRPHVIEYPVASEFLIVGRRSLARAVGAQDEGVSTFEQERAG
jgi:ribonuclease Z